MRIVIFWEGLPACGLLLNGLVEEGIHSITVYATKPTVPFSNLEKFAFFNVNFWVCWYVLVVGHHLTGF